MVILSRLMKTATVQELRYQFAKISRWLEAGEKVEITKRGVPWIHVTPLQQLKRVTKCT